MKSFVRRLTDYLEKSDKAAEASNELKSNLAEVEGMLVGVKAERRFVGDWLSCAGDAGEYGVCGGVIITFPPSKNQQTGVVFGTPCTSWKWHHKL